MSTGNANDFPPFLPVHLSEPPGRTGLVRVTRDSGSAARPCFSGPRCWASFGILSMHLPWPGVPSDLSLVLVALFVFSLETNPLSAVCLQVFVCQCVTCVLCFLFIRSLPEPRPLIFHSLQDCLFVPCLSVLCVKTQSSCLASARCSSGFVRRLVGTENRSQKHLKRIWCQVSSFHPRSCHPLRFSMHCS